MEEHELIVECKNYNPAAQRIIYKKYYPIFFNVCNRFIFDQDDRKDVLQDAFLKIFSNISKFRSDGSFEGWMKRIVINDALTYLKKKNKQNIKSFSELNEFDQNDINIMDENEEDEENRKHNFTEEELLNAIKSIPENLRIVFNLACIEGYSHKEIASVLTISEENSRIRLMTARKKIKKKLYSEIKILKSNSI
jgi:RNA polymerase sigma-70 factor (ECF subfamily)